MNCLMDILTDPPPKAKSPRPPGRSRIFIRVGDREYTVRQLEDITGYSTSRIHGWRRAGYLQKMIENHFRRKGLL